MKQRILLVSLNRCTVPDPVFPLGLACIGAALREAGHEVRWFDCLTETALLESVLAEYQPNLVGVSLRNVDDVQIRWRVTYFPALTGVCQAIRAAWNCPIVLGGSGFSLFPLELLARSTADFGVRGEGESSLVALVEALARSADPSAIPGLVYRRGGVTVANPPATAPLEGRLSPADRPAAVVESYLRSGGMLNLQTQRGCGHRCCYCTYPLIEGRAWRARPPEAVADEMAQLQAAGADYVFIVDSVFNSSLRHVTGTCEAILRRNLRLRWGCFLRPQGLTAESMRLMARAGLTHIEFGSDSFADPVLAAYGKGLAFDDIRESSELARRECVDQCHFLICGGPGETRETLATSYLNSQRLQGAVVMAVVGMRVYPGTALEERARREGLVPPGADLVDPAYYLAPGLTAAAVFGHLEECSRQSANWIVGDATPAYIRMVERLRSRGVKGPLWSYLALLQRIGSPAAAASPA